MTRSPTNLTTLCTRRAERSWAICAGGAVASLVLLALLMPLAVNVAAADVRVWWWHRPVVRQELALAPEQVRALDRIYRQSLPGRRMLRRRLESLEQRFELVLRRGASDPGSTRALVDSLTEARRRSGVARTMMLVRMLGVLDTAQRRRLAQIAGREGG